MVGIVFWVFFFSEKTTTVHYHEGNLAPATPNQTPTLDNQFLLKGFIVTPLADFEIEAKVLSKKKYYFGRTAELSPIDLVLGWGHMSDDSILQAIDISQRNRWYYWRVKNFPIPKREIETHSANMHMVPADKHIEKQLKRIKRGQIINIKGNLIRIDANDGWHWVSSLSRDDIGDGSCEIIFVESIAM